MTAENEGRRPSQQGNGGKIDGLGGTSDGNVTGGPGDRQAFSINNLFSEPSWKAEARAKILRFWNVISQPGDVREVRIFKSNKYGHTAAGWFDNPEALAEAVLGWNGVQSCYITVNPVKRALFARVANRIDPHVKDTTDDVDIERRKRLFIDIDSERPKGISATDGEIEAAREVRDAITTDLRARGWPEPVIFMSGNGWGLLYRIDLPNDAESKALCENVLKALAHEFDTEKVKIDPSVFSAGQLMSLVGTLKMKGDDIPERPHRYTGFVSAPEHLETVDISLLEALEPPDQSSGGSKSQEPGGQKRVGRWRNNFLTSQAGLMRKKGLEPESIFAALLAMNLAICEPPLGEAEVKKIAYGMGRYKAGTQEAVENPEGLPEIVITGEHLNKLSGAGWAALVRLNDPPRLFQREDKITDLKEDEEGRHLIKVLSIASIRGRLDRSAIWLRATEKALVPARPPKDVIEDMLAMDKPLPIIRGIIGTPIFASDGVLTTEEGYQGSTRLFYAPVGLAVPVIPENPSAADLERAKQLLFGEWLFDFPFANQASRANFIGAALTPLARELIDGPTPMLALDAPTEGTGKGLLAETLGVVISGASLAVMSDVRHEEEIRKRVTSILTEGPPVVLIDNVKRRLDSTTLDALLTSTVWTDRILGTNEMVRLPNRSLWLCTGNNLGFDGEIKRRVVWCRLDSFSDRPRERSGFRHNRLTLWVREHRHELVWALLVLVQNWLAAGRPGWNGKQMGSYEAWCDVVGGTLQAARIPGFLENREDLYRQADTESEDWRAFVLAWWESFRPKPVKAAQLLALAQREQLLLSLFATAPDMATERSLVTRLGVALSERRDRRYGAFFIRISRDAHDKGARYRLELAPDRTRPVEPSREDDRGSAI